MLCSNRPCSALRAARARWTNASVPRGVPTLAVTRQGPITDPRKLPARPLMPLASGRCRVVLRLRRSKRRSCPVELVPGMGPQLFLEGIQQKANPLRRGDNIDVIEEGEKGLALQAPVDCSKGRVLIRGSPCSPPSHCRTSWQTPASSGQT